MPVRSTDIIIDNLGIYEDLTNINMLPSTSVIDVDDICPNSEPLLSDDIWKKFEFDFPELYGVKSIYDEFDITKHTSSLFPLFDVEECVLRNHDCMWAGHCASKEHPADEPRAHNLNCIIPKPPVIAKPPQMKPPQVTQQQSVLKPTVRAAAAAAAAAAASSTSAVIQHTPQTPPESDDEENKAKPSKLLQILNDAISEYDLDEDSDLCEYFEEGNADVKEETIDIKEETLMKIKEEIEEEVMEEEKYKVRTFTQIAAENDHSYYKDKNASMMRHISFELDTPSDSEEEEIDVVSVNDKLISGSNRMVCTLPTNPSTRDRQQLQRRMATAMTKKRIKNNIKTILPVRKQSVIEPTTVKRKQQPETNRGLKRSKSYRPSPCKKRARYNNYSDSEPEPSEKRSLHNNMERQRRIDLRNAFEDLRVLVPEVSKKDRAAKVVILREAAQYCTYLGNASNNHTRHIEELRKQQEWLRSRVSQLRRNLAAKR